MTTGIDNVVKRKVADGRSLNSFVRRAVCTAGKRVLNGFEILKGLFTRLGNLCSQKLPNSNRALAGATIGAALMPTVHAQMFVDPSSFIPSASAAADFPGALAVDEEYSNGSTIINFNTTGSLLGYKGGYTYFEVPQHALADPHERIASVGVGLNVNSLSTTLENVEIVSKGLNYDQANPASNSSDWILARSTTQLPFSFYPQRVADTVKPGDILTVVSFGLPQTDDGTLQEGLLGNKFLFNTPVTKNVPLNVDPSSFVSGVFNQSSPLYLNGNATPRASGAPVYDKNRNLVGFVNGGVAGLSTTVADLTRDNGFSQEFNSYIGYSGVPENKLTAIGTASALIAFAGIRIFRPINRKR